MASKRQRILVFALVLCFLTRLNAQQAQTDKFGLEKDSQLPIDYNFRTVADKNYQDLIVNISLGIDGNDKTPTQTAPFALDFNSNMLLATQYSQALPKGFNVAQDQGFDPVSTDPVDLKIRGNTYSTKVYKTWVRTKAALKASATIPKVDVSVFVDTPKWVAAEGSQHGILGLGPKSQFFQALIQTYKPAQGDTDRIPVSWSLNPIDDSKLFSSSATFKNDTFILNGKRTTEKQYEQTTVVKDGVWNFPGMDFKLGSSWSAIKKNVCIDPNADATVAVPLEDFNQIWKAIQAASCDGKSFTECSYDNDKIAKVPKFEIAFESATEFKPQVTLNGTDIIKSVGDKQYSPKGISQNTLVSSVCDKDSIVLGRWFFTKVELTFSISTKDSTDVKLSLSNIENKNKPGDNESSGSRLLIILLIVFGLVAVAIIGFFVWIKRRENFKGDSDYLPTMDHDASGENKTFEGR
jgi:hypothetical protein